MSIAELVADLASAGILLWEDNGELRFRGPRGEMTPERRDRLREHKAAVIDHLRAGDLVRVQAQPELRHEPFPLTDVQSAYLLGSGGAFAYGNVSCHAYGELELDEIDPARMEEAWNRLVARHDMLRAVVEPDGHQRVRPTAPRLTMPVADLRGHDASVGQAEIDQVRAELDHRRYLPGEWPLFEMRATLLDDRAVLHVSVDFLIADYVSIHLMLEELRALYLDQDAVLPLPEVTFRDYLVAERAVRRGPRYERDRRYWTDRLDDLPAAPDLPVDESVSRYTPGRFRRYELHLSETEWAAVQRGASACGLTASGAVLAAYAEVIARWSTNRKFMLDLTLLNRLPLHPDVDRIVGDFTSVELLAVDHDPERTFVERAKALHGQLLEDLDHRLYSGVEVLRDLARHRGAEGALMPVVFTSAIGLGAGVPEWQLRHGVSQTPQVWIDCQAMETPDGLRINWDVREGVLRPGVVEAMTDAFADLLRALATDDGLWQSHRPVPLPAEQAARRELVNATEARVPDALLHEGFFAAAEREPGRRAVVTASGTELTYGELAARAVAVAAELREHGCEPGDRIAVVMDKGWEQVAAVLGVLLAGGVYLPVDAHQPVTRRERILTDAEIDVVLTQSWCDALADHTVVEVDLLAPAEVPSGKPERLREHDDLAYVIYTSGSTGSPKGVMITHRAAMNTLDHITELFGVHAEDRVLCLANLGFDLSVYDVFGVLAVGGTLVFPDSARRADPSHWAALVREHGVTLWNTVPAQLHMLAEYLRGEDESGLDTLRLALLSGDWIPVALPDRIRALIPGLRLISLGGATEAAVWSIYHPIKEVSPEWTSILYGKPLPNQWFQVLDEGLEPCPEEVAGELYIGGVGLATGYLNDPERSAQRFLTHPRSGQRIYRTGDRGRYRSDGEIEFLGRVDNQAKIRGHRIEPGEIEAAMQEDPAVSSAAVIVAGEPPLGRYLVGFAEIGRGDARRGIDGDELREHARRSAAEVADGVDVGKVVTFAEQLDHTALLAMLHLLRESGLFLDGQSHPLAGILSAVGAAHRHHRLVRRWLSALVDNGFLTRDDEGYYQATRSVDRAEVEAAWKRVYELLPDADDRAPLVEYFQHAERHLPELLRGEQDPVQLLFPEGSMQIQESAYNEGFLSRYLNRIAVSTLRGIADRWDGPLRVLEVGAGVGGTSIDAIGSLFGADASYLFTDVSQFFLNKAEERFGHLPWVDYALYDMNQDYRPQGLAPNSFDVVLCGNVMHYSKNAAVVLERMRELIAPGGWLVFIETTQDAYQILTSMEFLFDADAGDFEDVRNGRDQTFIARDEWHELLAGAGAEIAFTLPEQDEQLSRIGMYVFAARFKADRTPVDVTGLADGLASRLPADMLPAQYQLVDRIPLTDNGKVDRSWLAAWHVGPSKASPGRAITEPETDLERRVAAVWASVLQVQQVGREQDFYGLGGDSLLAAQLVGRLRETLPEARPVFFDELLREVLTNTTVAALSALLVERSDVDTTADADQAQSLVLHGNVDDPGDEPLTVLVRDGFGDEDGYRQLCGAFAEHGVVAELRIVPRGAPIEPTPDAVARLVDSVAETVMEPGFLAVRLVAAHFGGVFAVELAGRLAEAGVEVTETVVISSYPLPAEVEDDALAEYLFLRGKGVDPTALGFPDEQRIGDALVKAVEQTPGQVPAGALGLPELAAWAARPDADRLAEMATAVESTVDDVAAALAAGRAVATALVRHQPTSYAGDVTLLQDRDGTPLWPSLHTEMADWWRATTLGSLAVHEVAGGHFECVDAAHAAELAKTILDLVRVTS